MINKRFFKINRKNTYHSNYLFSYLVAQPLIVSPLILLARAKSLVIAVTLPACKAQALTSSKSPQTYDSVAS